MAGSSFTGFLFFLGAVASSVEPGRAGNASPGAGGAPEAEGDGCSGGIGMARRFGLELGAALQGRDRELEVRRRIRLHPGRTLGDHLAGRRGDRLFEHRRGLRHGRGIRPWSAAGTSRFARFVAKPSPEEGFGIATPVGVTPSVEPGGAEAVHPGREDLVLRVVRAAEDRSLVRTRAVRDQGAGEDLALGQVLGVDQAERGVEVRPEDVGRLVVAGLDLDELEAPGVLLVVALGARPLEDRMDEADELVGSL